MNETQKPRWMQMVVAVFLISTITACGTESTPSPIKIEPSSLPDEATEPTVAHTETPVSPPSTDIPLAPTSTSFSGPDVFFNGIDFAFGPSLGEIVRVEKLEASPCESMSPFPPHLGFTFEPYNEIRNQFEPNIAVYSVREFEELCLEPEPGYLSSIVWVNDILDPLREVVNSRSIVSNVAPLPFLNAGELLRVQEEFLLFQNGSGVRAIVMYAQDLWFVHNEAITYYFQGLTDDGEYYVTLRFPITAPFLIDGAEPDKNQNEGAIPILEYDPGDYQQLAQAVEAYNEEARMQLEVLGASGFTPDLSALDALVATLRIEPQLWGE
jgi:hypothetical protein